MATRAERGAERGAEQLERLQQEGFQQEEERRVERRALGLSSAPASCQLDDGLPITTPTTAPLAVPITAPIAGARPSHSRLDELTIGAAAADAVPRPDHPPPPCSPALVHERRGERPHVPTHSPLAATAATATTAATQHLSPQLQHADHHSSPHRSLPLRASRPLATALTSSPLVYELNEGGGRQHASPSASPSLLSTAPTAQHGAGASASPSRGSLASVASCPSCSLATSVGWHVQTMQMYMELEGVDAHAQAAASPVPLHAKAAAATRSRWSALSSTVSRGRKVRRSKGAEQLPPVSYHSNIAQWETRHDSRHNPGGAGSSLGSGGSHERAAGGSTPQHGASASGGTSVKAAAGGGPTRSTGSSAPPLARRGRVRVRDGVAVRDAQHTRLDSP